MLAQELVNLKVDVVIAQSTSSALAARQATTTTLGPEAARREVSDEPGQGAPLPRANFADESG
ncbi:MAG TPA: hypothetical protein VFO08_14195 [Methylomirabilota bacterium]|nr:hypothetical protein [Methylomirabilota bacterium]